MNQTSLAEVRSEIEALHREWLSCSAIKRTFVTNRRIRKRIGSLRSSARGCETPIVRAYGSLEAVAADAGFVRASLAKYDRTLLEAIRGCQGDSVNPFNVWWEFRKSNDMVFPLSGSDYPEHQLASLLLEAAAFLLAAEETRVEQSSNERREIPTWQHAARRVLERVQKCSDLFDEVPSQSRRRLWEHAAGELGRRATPILAVTLIDARSDPRYAQRAVERSGWVPYDYEPAVALAPFDGFGAVAGSTGLSAAIEAWVHER